MSWFFVGTLILGATIAPTFNFLWGCLRMGQAVKEETIGAKILLLREELHGELEPYDVVLRVSHGEYIGGHSVEIIKDLTCEAHKAIARKGDLEESLRDVFLVCKIYEIYNGEIKRKFRFQHILCSSCGEAFGPGDHGFSHCDSHQGQPVFDDCGRMQ